MNEQVDNAEYEFLWKLLADPANPNHSYIFNLQSLVTDFPQSGALRALLMPNGDKRHLKHAAAYFNPRTLHKLATAPDSLPRVTAGQIVFSDEPPVVAADAYFNIPGAEQFVPPVVEPEAEAPYVPVVDDEVAEDTAADYTHTPYNTFSEPEPATDATLVDNTAPYHTFAEPLVDQSPESEVAYIEDEPQTYNHPLTPTDDGQAQPDPVTYAYTTQENYLHESETAVTLEEEIEVTQAAPPEEQSLAQQYDTYITESEAAPTETVSSYDERYFHQAIDDEVYDEIVSIEDIGLEQLAIINKSAKEEENNEAAASTRARENYFYEPKYEEPVAVQQPVASPEPVKATDMHPAVATQKWPTIQPQTIQRQAKSNLSNYNDEKMPYTFMWWLDKTRKEHANIYQPYVSNRTAPPPAPKATREVVDELQKQYYQNIVSHSPLADLDKNPAKASAATHDRKEDKIIERFIQQEPHIQHPSGTKLDNENKAKRSSEDKEELVTETLARIYTEQMLFHKAILTYKKLMLKYPEKSLYFAGQIEQLENKIN
ncbi:hypothetical protein [Mucilaginibacter sp. UYCu711]|uniref:hypothetical protein n=1 Tax=Mucilaginibacter sp. UYCu711 TaxID=3156339 RepID=UPI003D1EE0A5